jgi:hypothetical protein
MILALLVLGLLLLSLPAIAAPASPRLPARDWTCVVMLALVAGVATVLGALVLASVPVLAWTLDAPTVVDHCRGVLAPIATDPTLLSWTTAGLVVLLGLRMVRGGSRAFVGARRSRVEPWLGEHTDEGGYVLVVLATPEVVAFGVPGQPPQVVISTGLIDVLEPPETAAVIAHEVAHHRLRHARLLALLSGIERSFSWFPPAARSIETGRTAIEAWADDAAGHDQAARRSLRSALRGMTRRTWHADQRVARLASRMPARTAIVRFASYAPVAVIVVTAAVLVAGWLTDAHHAVALGFRCHH